LRKKTDGLFVDKIVELIPSYSTQLYTDAIESAIEDEYIERVSQDDNQELYRAIIYDEYD